MQGVGGGGWGEILQAPLVCAAMTSEVAVWSSMLPDAASDIVAASQHSPYPLLSHRDISATDCRNSHDIYLLYLGYLLHHGAPLKSDV